LARRILTGYRPTGKLHLGNLHGNLKMMVELQEQAECFFFIADWHALTTDYQDPRNMRPYTEEMVLDWLAAGVDPEKATVYRQSDMPEVAEFQLYLSMITPLGWLERVPSFKEQQDQLQNKDISTHGFLGYPVLQAADILIVRADAVRAAVDALALPSHTRDRRPQDEQELWQLYCAHGFPGGSAEESTVHDHRSRTPHTQGSG